MKWKVGSLPEVGTTRVIAKFAIFPISINGETKWLEMVYIKQIFNTEISDEGFPSWKNCEFTGKYNYLYFIGNKCCPGEIKL
jgi:hypothetical protein